VSISAALGERRSVALPGGDDRVSRARPWLAGRFRPRRRGKRRPLARCRAQACRRAPLHRARPSARSALEPREGGHRPLASRPRPGSGRPARGARARRRLDRRQRHRRRRRAMARRPPPRARRTACPHLVRSVREVPAEPAALSAVGRALARSDVVRGAVGSVEIRPASAPRLRQGDPRRGRAEGHAFLHRPHPPESRNPARPRDSVACRRYRPHPRGGRGAARLRQAGARRLGGGGQALSARARKAPRRPPSPRTLRYRAREPHLHPRGPARASDRHR
jgi:hypothetical protein